MMNNTVVYDVEVLRSPDELETGWNSPQAMGFGTAVVYSYDLDQYLFYAPGQKDELIETLTGKNVVGFNSIRFDNKVLLGDDYKDNLWTDYDILTKAICSKFKVANIDLAINKYGFRTVFNDSFGLNKISKATLGKGKTGHGSHAPQLIREGKWADVFAYNLNDVRLTKQLYEFIQKYGFVVDGDNKIINIG